jgi:hypothetical protein
MLLVLLFGVPALIAAWVLLLPNPQPTPLLVVSVATYDVAIPPNGFAVDDAMRFTTVFGKDAYDNIALTVADEPSEAAEFLKQLDDFLATSKPGGPKGDVVLVYLSALGVVDDDHQPCLLLPGSRPLQPQTWVRMTDVLATLGKPRGREGVTTVLLLDAQRIDDAWRMGVVVNTFSDALDALLKKSLPPDCAVLTAASGLESAIAAPELGGTPFGFFVASGLRGEADAGADAVVSLQELGAFLVKNVDGWARQYRGVRQRPQLYAEGRKNVGLVHVSGAAKIAAQPWKPAITVDQFVKTFNRVERLDPQQCIALNPWAWAKMQYLFERLDAEALAGVAYEARARETLTLLEAALGELENIEPHRGVQPLSLAMIAVSDAKAPDAAVTQAWDAWWTDKTKAKVEPGSDPAAAEYAWRRVTAGEAPLTHDELLQALEFCNLAGKPPRNREEWTEIALLRLLDRHVDWGSGALSRGIPRALLVAIGESERLAAPADPRIHYVIAGPLAARDEQLESALDDTLIGNDDSIVNAEDTLRALRGAGADSLSQVARLSELASSAFLARDQALATAATLNQWWVREARRDLASRKELDVRPLTGPTLELAAYLDELMAQPADARGANSAQLQSMVAEVDRARSRLLERYGKHVDDVQVTQGGSLDRQAIETPLLLRCLVQWSERRRLLHESWFDRMAAPGAAAIAVPLDTATDGEDRERDLDYLRWLAAVGVEPLRQLLDGVGSSRVSTATAAERVDSQSSREDVERALAALGGRLRARLAGLMAECGDLDAATMSLAKKQQPASAARQGLSEADVVCRALAPLALGTSTFKADAAPSDRLRQLDTQAWISWQGRRAVDACWGSWQSAGTREAPYFARVATLAAADAARAFPAATYDPSDVLRRTNELLELMRKWTPLTPDELSVVDDGQGVRTNPLEFHGEPKMRPGEAAVFLANERGDLFTTYGAVEQPVRRVGASTQRGAKFEGRLKLTDSGNLPALSANAIFRGHVWSEEFHVARGVVVDWVWPGPEPATVVVRGDAKQVSQIVFVLDCSGSMSKDEQGKRVDRVAEGRDALERILNTLNQQGEQFFVSVVAFGHRAGYDANTGGLKQLVPNVFPGGDVETLVPMAPLTARQFNDVRAKLKPLKPLGETPLYRSLLLALEEFKPALGGSRQVIVLTDGVDEVSPHPNNPPATYERQVIDALARTPVRVDIMQFGPRNNVGLNAKQIAGRQALQRIVAAATPPGTFTPATEIQTLEDAILASLKLGRFAVIKPGESPPTSDEEYHDLSKYVTVPAPTAPEDLRVVLKSGLTPPAEIRIEGGEAVEILYRRAPVNEMIFVPYASDDPAQTILGYRVAAHEPLVGLQRAPEFRVSIQSTDNRVFSRRPEVIWAKVTPLGEDEPRSYYFVDREFERGRQAPVLLLRAQNWSQSDAARIELTFAAERAGLSTRPPLPVPARGTQQYAVEGATLDVRLQVAADEMYEVVVDEVHAPGADNDPLHVQIEPPPNSVRRVFFEGRRSVHTVYRYAGAPVEPKLRVLTRREIEKGGANLVFEHVDLPRR